MNKKPIVVIGAVLLILVLFYGGALLPSAQGKDLGYVVKVSIPDNDCNGEIDSFHYVLVAELKDDNGGLQQVKKYLAYDQATEKVWLE